MKRPVRPVETPSQALPTSDLRVRLEATRDLLTGLLAEAGARDAAPLARELRATLKELSMLHEPAEESDLDRLRRERAARRPAASGQ